MSNITFKYYSNTENVEFRGEDTGRNPINMLYTVLTSIPVGDYETLNAFNILNMVFGDNGSEQFNLNFDTQDYSIPKLGPYNRINKTSTLLDEKCSICLDNFKPMEGYRTLKCGHHFHKKCVDRWLSNGSMECPLCRKNAWTGKESDK